MNDIIQGIFLISALSVFLIAILSGFSLDKLNRGNQVISAACSIFVTDSVHSNPQYVEWLKHFSEWLFTRNRGVNKTQSVAKIFDDYRQYCYDQNLGGTPHAMACYFEQTVNVKDLFPSPPGIRIDLHSFAKLILKALDEQGA